MLIYLSLIVPLILSKHAMSKPMQEPSEHDCLQLSRRHEEEELRLSLPRLR